MKLKEIIRSIIYLLLAILIFIFHGLIMSDGGIYLKYVVGLVMVVFGAEEIISLFIDKKIPTHLSKLDMPILTILFGIITIFVIKDNEYEFIILCVLWSSWSIVREFNEIKEKVVEEKNNKITALLNFIESIVVIILSVLFLIRLIEATKPQVQVQFPKVLNEYTRGVLRD